MKAATILVVDDEGPIVEVSKEILNILGHKVMTARSGHEAIEIYEREKENIDLVLLDVVMPDMGGGPTFDHLKTLNPDIKVILVSGYGLHDEVAEVMMKGCRFFIQKPYRIQELSQKIAEALEPVPILSPQN